MKPVDDVARALANAHKKADPDIRQIYLIEDPSGKEVRLVEVSDSVGFTGTVMPFRFAARPDLDVPYPSVLILLSPEEKALLDRKELDLPRWPFHRRIWPSSSSSPTPWTPEALSCFASHAS
ncbi:MAG: hypothetical protein WCI05_07010 [Myxococcales bacterium]